MDSFKTYDAFFRKVLEKHFAVEKAESIMKETEVELDGMHNDLTFVDESPNPMDRRIALSGIFLALIKVLDKQGMAMESIRSLCTAVALEYVRPKNRVHRKLKSWTGKMIQTVLGKLLIRQMIKRTAISHPDGFAIKIITDPKETFGLGYGIDIHQCGICKLFHKHQYDHYANILCDVDHITSGLSGLELIRTGTVANGAPKCDFRFKAK